MSYGFITPPSIHYVRNHGPCPRINWGDHRVVVNGLVSTPLTLTMDDIISMPSVRIPVTLVCAGNRRKEENMLKKSIGFNWGPCAVSTTYWTGVRLRDILLRAGIKTPEEGANYVCMRGPKGELPKGSDGSYGTSVTYNKAMDLASDVIVAYKQNDRWLTPDHGFPVRMIIPGFIGGRMIKWLEVRTISNLSSSISPDLSLASSLRKSPSLNKSRTTFTTSTTIGSCPLTLTRPLPKPRAGGSNLTLSSTTSTSTAQWHDPGTTRWFHWGITSPTRSRAMHMLEGGPRSSEWRFLWTRASSGVSLTSRGLKSQTPMASTGAGSIGTLASPPLTSYRPRKCW